MKKSIFSNLLILLVSAFGIICGFIDHPIVLQAANLITTIFLKLLKLIGVPIVFLSLISNISGMQSLHEMKTLGKKIFQYAIFAGLGFTVIKSGVLKDVARSLK